MTSERSELSYLDRFRGSTRRRTRSMRNPEPLIIPERWPTVEKFKAAFDATRIPRNERRKRFIPKGVPYRFNS